MRVSQLKLNPTNPRVIKDNRFEKLVNSIRDFPEMMEKRPMVCVTGTDGKLFPLGGNMRLKAIQHLGMKEIPDTWITMADEWTEEQRREFIIKDNLPGGEWDWDTLVNEWDQDKLEEWGLEMPNFESSEVDISDKITESFKIEISCNDESEQEKTYNYLIEKGYNCRLLSL